MARLDGSLPLPNEHQLVSMVTEFQEELNTVVPILYHIPEDYEAYELLMNTPDVAFGHTSRHYNPKKGE